MGLLLDTHIWIWAASNPARLRPGIVDEIARADVLILSVASVWEAAVKEASRKLTVDGGVRALVDHAFETMGVRVLPIAAEHALEAASLPGHHGDPFDRMLVAQARVDGLTIVTVDETIRAYDVSVMWGRD